MPNTFIWKDDGDVPAYAPPLTPEQQRVADLEFRLAQQEYKLTHVAYLMKRLDAARKSLEAEEERRAEQAEYIEQLHRSIARLGARGEAALTKDRCWTLSLKITDEVIVKPMKDVIIAEGERVDITVRKRESTGGPLFSISFPKSFYQKSPEEQGAIFVQSAEHAYAAFWEHCQKERG